MNEIKEILEQLDIVLDDARALYQRNCELQHQSQVLSEALKDMLAHVEATGGMLIQLGNPDIVNLCEKAKSALAVNYEPGMITLNRADLVGIAKILERDGDPSNVAQEIRNLLR